MKFTYTFLQTHELEGWTYTRRKGKRELSFEDQNVIYIYSSSNTGNVDFIRHKL